MYTKMFQKKYFSIDFLKMKIKNTIFEFTIHRWQLFLKLRNDHWLGIVCNIIYKWKFQL